MGIRLEVRTQDPKWADSPEGFRSTDDEPELLSDFCGRHNIPYSSDFVSIWAMPSESSQRKNFADGRSTWLHRNADSYGTEIIVLGEPVVDSLAYVVAGDFKNIISRANVLEIAGDDFQSFLDEMLLIFPSTMRHGERVAQLERLSKKARTLNRKGDAEARLLRRLRNCDKA